MFRRPSLFGPNLFPSLALLAACLAAFPGSASGQQAGELGPEAIDSTLVQEVELRDGSTLVGRVIRVADGRMTFRTLDDVEVTFRLNQIHRIQTLEGVRHGREFWPRDPSDSRLFIGPTARVPGDGRGYAGVYELLFPSAAIGFGDVAMVSGGMSMFPGAPLNEQIYYVSPKIRLVGNDWVGAAAGVLWLALGFDDKSAGLAYGVVTAESETASLTVGPAFPFLTDGGFTDEVLGLVGIEARVSRGLKVMSENWILPGGEGAFFTFGLRLLADRFTIEAGALVPSEGELVLPVASFSTTW